MMDYQNGGKRIDCEIHIRENSTGKIRYFDETLGLDEDGVPIVFNWEEGNYSCDCNRQSFFERVNNPQYDEDTVCSDGKFSVNIYDSDHRLLYTEFKE